MGFAPNSHQGCSQLVLEDFHLWVGSLLARSWAIRRITVGCLNESSAHSWVVSARARVNGPPSMLSTVSKCLW
jgi:hypothetical protein